MVGVRGLRTKTSQLRLLVAEARAWSRGNMESAASSDGGGAACRKTEADWCRLARNGNGVVGHLAQMGAECPDSELFLKIPLWAPRQHHAQKFRY